MTFRSGSGKILIGEKLIKPPQDGVVMKKEVTFEFESEDFEADVISAIQDLAASIGWSMAFLDDDIDDQVDHIIVGTEAAIEEVDKAFQCYTILVPIKEESEWSH